MGDLVLARFDRAARPAGRAALAGGLLALAACGADVVDTAVARVDSAGVTITESAAPRWSPGQEWTVDTAPLLDLTRTGTGQPHEFERVADARMLDDGSIVVADGGAHEVRLYSPTGAFRWAVGREGGGPGEFEQLWRVAPAGPDSLLAFDFWLGRATFLSRDGAVGPALHPFRRGPGAEDVLLVGDSLFVALVSAYESMAGHQGLLRIPTALVTADREGRVRDTLAIVPGIETYVLPDGDTRPLFARRAHVAVAGTDIYAGAAERLEYHVYAASGGLRRIVRVPTYDLRLSREEIQRERAFYLGPRPNARRRTIVDALPDPATRPAYEQLVVDATGAVWTAGFRAWSDTIGPTRWQLFAPDGAWLGAVELPRRLRVLEIGRDRLLGVWRDADDVERVRVYRLRR